MRYFLHLLLLGGCLTLLLSMKGQAAPVFSQTLKKVSTATELQAALGKWPALYLAPGRYRFTTPLTLNGLNGVTLIGGGRSGNTTVLEFAPGMGLTLENCRNLTVCNLSVQSARGAAEGACVDILGTNSGDIRFLNCNIGGNNILKKGALGLPGVRVRAPAKLLLQGTHLSHSDPGLLIDHPQAEVTVLGGNYQSTTRHMVQKDGLLRVYAVGFQLAYEGVDVLLNKAASKPFVMAAVRSEGPGCLLATPTTSEKIDVVLKANGGCPENKPVGFLDYRAQGRVWLLGNNVESGITLPPEAKGAIWSLGNYYGTKWKIANPYVIGGSTLSTAGDLWTLIEADGKYREPTGGVITEEEYKSKGFASIPANLTFLKSGDPLSFPPADPPVKPVMMPLIANAADLLPTVKQYGAAGDGTTDDTAALQRALDANRHGPLYFPAGVYRVTKPVLILRRHGGWLVGAGMDKTVITNTEGGGAVATDGCGYATFQDLSFISKDDAKGAAFDLSWNRKNTVEIPGYSGAALQANNFYRCRFQGGEYALSIGTAGWMGSETLLAGCEFLRASVAGLATRNYNALTDNAVDCLFKGNKTAAYQAHAGSFNIFNSRFEDSTDFDLITRNSAVDCFYIANSTTNGRKLLASGHTGARINVFFDNFRVLQSDPAAFNQWFYSYASGGSVVWLGGTPGGGRVTSGGGIAGNAHLFLGTEFKIDKPTAVSGRAKSWSFPVPKEK
ncbi:MAG: glycosyl hydrolase family 28-related protein [Armatimonadota bacterium]